MNLRYIFLTLLLLAAAYAGAHYRASQIQATCEADDTPTVINGTTYLCLSQRQLERMQRQSERRA